MIDVDKIDDFPVLVPDKAIRFEAKDELRRSAEMNYECSELEYNDIVAEEELVEKYRIRLAPDVKIAMPNKNALKHSTSNRRVIWLSLSAVAATLALVLIIVNNMLADKSVDYPAVVVSPESQSETKMISKANPKPKPATDPNPKPVIRSGKTAKNKTNIAVKKAITTAEEPISTTVEQDIVPETPENVRIEKLERIASIAVPVEVINKEKTVFVFQSDRRQISGDKSIDKIAIIIQKISTDVADTKDNISKIIDSFRVPAFLSRLSLDRGIDKEIDEWAKNNPDIPFNVFIDYASENKMKEVYDENGTLVRVIFFTNKSLKYRNNKTYNALNNK
jgi:hypothetical protein